jgi:hypothetical protein
MTGNDDASEVRMKVSSIVSGVLGALSALWGAFILYSVVRGPSMPNECDKYAAGPVKGAIFGTLVFVAGLYFLIRRLSKRNKV